MAMIGRHIIQLATQHNGRLVALCSDGSVWEQPIEMNRLQKGWEQVRTADFSNILPEKCPNCHWPLSAHYGLI